MDEFWKALGVGLGIGLATLLAWAGPAVLQLLERRESAAYRRGWEAAKKEDTLERANQIIDRSRAGR